MNILLNKQVYGITLRNFCQIYKSKKNACRFALTGVLKIRAL